jgi:hypothetical protein
MKRLIIIAAALVIVANAAVLARVAYNRSAVVHAITLTERELIQPYRYSEFREDENSGLRLRLQSSVARTATDRSWRYDHGIPVDEQKILQFGFDPMKNCDDSYESRGGRDRSRKGWVALEYDGPAHAKLIQQVRRLPQDELRNRDEELARLEQRDSRLYVVDVATDKDELNAKYRNSGHLILPAKVSNYSNCDRKHKLYVEVLARHVNVPAQFHSFFAQIPQRSYLGEKDLPAYRAQIAIGKLNEPWLVKLETIEYPQP